MIVYHGTTNRRAQRICIEGFLPKKPSKRVWFAKGHGYALGRARTQARRSHDRAVVLTCEIDLQKLRDHLGTKKVMYKSGIVAIDGPVPVNVLRSHTSAADQPSSPGEIAQWVNQILRLKPHKGVSSGHPGVLRLSRWVVNRLAVQNKSIIRKTEMLDKARQWLPGMFENVVIDPDTLHASYEVKTIEVRADNDSMESLEELHEEEAVDCLVEDNPKHRIKGLSMLAKIEESDLFDWCLMFLDDESCDVRLAALRTMLLCEDGDADSILHLSESADKRIRGAAIAAIARHSGRQGAKWVKYGLMDPSPCVRVAVAKVMRHFDPARNREVFRMALHDPNHDVSRIAEKLTEGQGFSNQTPRIEKRRTHRYRAEVGRQMHR